jgi:hypothetical protein
MTIYGEFFNNKKEICSLQEYLDLLDKFKCNINKENIRNIKIKYNTYCIYFNYFKYLKDTKQKTNLKLFKFKKCLGFLKYPSSNIMYFIDRGWSKDEAKKLYLKRQQTFTIESVAKRYNLSQKEAKEKITNSYKKGIKTAKQNPNWLKNKRQSIKKARLYVENNKDEWHKKLLKGAKKLRRDIKDGKREYLLPYHVKYWLKRGYTQKESLELVSERQRTFTKEKCIKKYGERDGIKRWEQRQIKWRAAMDAKSPEEKREILLKQIKPSQFYSNESINFFNTLIDSITYLKIENILYKQNELKLYDSIKHKLYMFDFTIPTLKIIIEYNGGTWHPDFEILSEKEIKEWKNPFTGMDAYTKQKEDNEKLDFARKLGYNIYVVWNTRDLKIQLDYIKGEINKCSKH